MTKWSKVIIAVMLLPFCLGATNALIRVVRTMDVDTFWVPLLAGASCWIVIYALLPRPMWLYVFGHELTHAVWVWIFGGKVRRFKATSKGGQVVVTKNNALISLAPYFFPIYVLAIACLFSAGYVWFGWTRYLAYFHLLIGAAYAFHITLTAQVLQTRQTDLTRHGYFFSGVVIWLANVGFLVLGLPLMTPRVGLLTALGWCWIETGKVFQRIGQIF